MDIYPTTMQTTFSPQLIARAKKIFERRSGRAVSVEETERYLDALAKLGLIAAKVLEAEKRRNGKEVRTCG